MKTVCVVGAGPSGLVAAKTLLRSKEFNVTVYEKAERIGGIWALDENTTNGYLSPDTPTNLSKFTVGFSDLDWNSINVSSAKSNSLYELSAGNWTSGRPPLFPKAWHVNRYLETYRKKYIPDGTIKLDREVTRTERLEENGSHRWRVSTQTIQADEETAEFDYLVLGSGFFATPRPLSHNIKGISTTLKVKTVHSSQFRTLEDLFDSPQSASGKTILVIGGGNSAGEAAASVAQQISNANYSPESGPHKPYKDCRIVHVVPRPLYALPPMNPCDETSTTFTTLDLKLYDLARRGAGPIVGGAGRVARGVKDVIHANLQNTIGGDQSDLGAPALVLPQSEPRPAVYVALSETYPEFVRSGSIEVIKGRVTSLEDPAGAGPIARWTSDDNGDGEVANIGAIIYATGYSPATALEFLPEDVKEKMHYDADSLRLPLVLHGWQTLTPEVPDLAFIGFYEGPYWPMMEMQARLTARRWSQSSGFDLQPQDETSGLLDLRKAMQERALDVPQYWYSDYAGYMEEVASYLSLQRNDGSFADREGCVAPGRYLSADSDKAEADAMMEDLAQIWRDCREKGKYVARAIFRALQGNWTMKRTIDSALSTFPSGTLEGRASFYPRAVTEDKSEQTFDFEYLYDESGTLTLANGASMPARRRYVYRYSEERDELSVWFVKPDKDFEVDYLFHNFLFISPEEAKKQGACVANGDHLCVEDMYKTEYRLPLKGIALHDFQVKHQVKGPSKDYLATTWYKRPQKGSAVTA